MNSQRYKSGKKSAKTYKYYNDKNLMRGQRLFPPSDNYSFYNKNRNNQYRYNYSSKSYNDINHVLNNYMNEYEKLKQQNEAPKTVVNDYTYQEFEDKKATIMELFNNNFNSKKESLFNDTNKIIDDLPDYPDDMMLKNDIISDDYSKRLKIKVAQTTIKRNKKVSYKEEPDENEYIRKSNNKDKSPKNWDNIDVNNDKENKIDIKIEKDIFANDENHNENKPKKEENKNLEEINTKNEKESEELNIENNNEKKEKNLINIDKKEEKIEKEKGEEKIDNNNDLKKEEQKEDDDDYEGEFEIIENTLNKKEKKEEEKKNEENNIDEEDSDYGGFET